MSSSAGSPPTARVVQVLEHLAARPEVPRTATEIAREVGIARATCALVLDELASRGWLVRGRAGYVLGPQAVPVGRAAVTSSAGCGSVHSELAALADQLGVVCTTSGVVGDYIAVLDRVGPPPAEGYPVSVGMRFAFAPPSGIINVAWEQDRYVEDWLRRSPRPLTADDEQRLWQTVHDARADGVYIERLTDQVLRLQALLANLSTERLSDGLRRAVGDALVPLGSRGYGRGELQRGGTYPVSIVAAPVFDDDARARLVVAAFVVRAAVPYDETKRIMELVRAAADRLTEWAGGVDPWVTGRAADVRSGDHSGS